jgi:amino acid adenylation domain-containing protein
MRTGARGRGVSAGDFRLPGAWRSRDPETAERRSAVVPFGDLAEALRSLAAVSSATASTVYAAAHVKVLGTLVEGPAFSTYVLPAGGGRQRGTVKSLTARPGEARTWRGLVENVAGWLRDMPPATVTRLQPAARAELVIFADDAASLDEIAQPGELVHRYGLCVGVADDELLLHAEGFLGPSELARLASMYRRVLEAMAASPDADAAGAILPDGERDDVLRNWAAGPRVDRGRRNMLELFRTRAAKTPDAVAVAADGHELGYRELDLHSNRIAHRLLAGGAGPGTAVGVSLRRCLDLLPTLLGVWKTGAHYVPLDVDAPAARLRLMTSAAGVALLATHARHRALYEELDDTRVILLDEEREAIDALPATPVDGEPGPAQLAYVIYTSGSTGEPKGVMIHHGGLANYVLWTAREYAARGEGGSPHFSSIGFDLGVPSLFTPLALGQRVDLLPDPLDPADLGEVLAARAPYSFIKLTPGHLNMLSTDLGPEQAYGLAGLVIAAGDAFPADLARRWRALAGAGGTAVATEYGPTEITVGNSGAVVDHEPAEGLIPLGAPIPNTTMYVLDDRLEPVPEGVPGEVCVGGEGVARGYVNHPALTAQRFVPDPYGPPGSRLYRTGDRGRWRSGELEFLGRTDHQVKIRGYRVEPGEIRAALLRRPEVGEAVVAAYPAPSGGQRLAAFVIPVTADHRLDLSGLRKALAEDLPEYMVPALIRQVPEIPLTANGKVDTRALGALL